MAKHKQDYRQEERDDSKQIRTYFEIKGERLKDLISANEKQDKVLIVEPHPNNHKCNIFSFVNRNQTVETGGYIKFRDIRTKEYNRY